MGPGKTGVAGLVVVLAAAPSTGAADVRVDVAAGVTGGGGPGPVAYFLDELAAAVGTSSEGGPLALAANALLLLRPADISSPAEWHDVLAEARVSVGGGDGWWLHLGKSLAPMGWEEVRMADSSFATHGLHYDYGLPSTLTGALVEGPALADLLDVSGFVSHGIDAVMPEDRLAAGLRFDLAVSDALSLGLIGLVDGPAAADRVVWLGMDETLEVGAWLAGAEVTWGRVEVPGGGAASWAGAAATVIATADALGAGLRLEWFRDPGGWMMDEGESQWL